MKIKGFLKDITGSMRVTKRRNDTIKNASASREYNDPIRKVADECHPLYTELVVKEISPASPDSKKIVFKKADGEKLPPFEAGQYVSLELDIDGVHTTRAYTIASAPFEARLEKDPFLEIIVKRVKGPDGFASNYINDRLKVGDRLIAHLPYGEFYFEPLRDHKKILGLAGGSGITPFLSLAKEIKNGTLDAEITILYGCNALAEVMAKDELEALKGPKVKVVYVIKDEKEEADEHGFITSSIIEKYSKVGETSYFACGPFPMYGAMRKALEALKVPSKDIRFELIGAPHDIAKAPGYPVGKEKGTFSLTVCRGLEETKVEAKASESIAVALERAHIPNPTRCRSGMCGYCRCLVLEGDYFVPPTADGRRYSDKETGYVHACQTYPLSDLKIKIIIE